MQRGVQTASWTQSGTHGAALPGEEYDRRVSLVVETKCPVYDRQPLTLTKDSDPLPGHE